MPQAEFQIDTTNPRINTAFLKVIYKLPNDWTYFDMELTSNVSSDKVKDLPVCSVELNDKQELSIRIEGTSMKLFSEPCPGLSIAWYRFSHENKEWMQNVTGKLVCAVEDILTGSLFLFRYRCTRLQAGSRSMCGLLDGNRMRGHVVEVNYSEGEPLKVSWLDEMCGYENNPANPEDPSSILECLRSLKDYGITELVVAESK